MAKKWELSKSQFCRGVKCEKSLWLYRHRKDLLEETDNLGIDSGNDVGEAAMARYPQGVLVEAEFYQTELAEAITKDFIEKGHKVIFEATAKTADGHFSRIDILKKVPGINEWDLIEVKGATELKPYYEWDVAFQRFVFEGAGYKIRKSILMHINRDYVRLGDLDYKKLFCEVDLTDTAKKMKKVVRENIDILSKVLNRKGMPKVEVGEQCTESYVCDFYDHCHQHIPEFSVYDVFKSNDKRLGYCLNKGILDVKKIPKDLELTRIQQRVVEAHKKNRVHSEKQELSAFVETLEYPLYYLDYESIFSAIPLYDNSSPYSQIVFQYSLHIQKTPNGKLEHFEFVYEGQGDPREELVKSLVKNCGKKGSVVVYNETFEKVRNSEMAKILPKYRKDLLAINERVVDLYAPFRQRSLYHPKMNGSASIKSVLPAFVPKLSYKNLEIQNGGVASELYTKIAKGEVTKKEAKEIVKNLKAYCHLDTLAMVKLMEVVRGEG